MPQKENIELLMNSIASFNKGNIEGYLEMYDRASSSTDSDATCAPASPAFATTTLPSASLFPACASSRKSCSPRGKRLPVGEQLFLLDAHAQGRVLGRGADHEV